MLDNKLYIVMVGLPARGKSTIAYKLKENLTKYGIKTGIFNNGDLRRRLTGIESSKPDFYNPDNQQGVELREKSLSPTWDVPWTTWEGRAMQPSWMPPT